MRIRVKDGDGFVDYCPHPVGTWLHCEFDPNGKWPGTSWTRYGEGTYLVSSGATYKDLSNYGENAHVLTSDELAYHSHAILCNVAENVEFSGVEFAPNRGGAGWGFINDEEYHRDDIPMAKNKPHNNMPYSVAVPLWRRVG